MENLRNRLNNKDWAKSDELRNKLAELGYSVKDSKDGYELSVKE